MDLYEFIICLTILFVAIYLLMVALLDQCEEATFRLTLVAKRHAQLRQAAIAPRVPY